jgi:hypothetical protein
MESQVQTIIIDGQTYTLRPLKRAYLAMEEFILSNRIDPMDAAVAAVLKAPAAMHSAIWDAAMRAVLTSRRVASIREMADFEHSMRGYAWKLWQCVKQDHTEIDSIEKAIELLEKFGPERASEVDDKLRQLTEGVTVNPIQTQEPTPNVV